MPKPLVLPATYGEYSQRFVPAPSFILDEPTEGRRVIPLNISWNTADGDAINNATHINLQGRVTQADFSRIRALFVDNSQSGADVTIIFIDTQWQVTIPAGKADLVPVSSGRLDFYVVANMATANDKTFMQAFNYMPPAFDISRPDFQTVASSVAVGITTASNPNLIAAGINGTIRNLTVQLGGAVGGGGGAGSVLVFLQDGQATPQVVQTSLIGLAIGQVAPPALLFSQSSMSVRFVNGLTINVVPSGTAFASGSVIVNASYRVP